MSEPLSRVYLARHGETAWTISGQHTGLTDLPLTPRGEQDARRLGERLKGLSFAAVFASSPEPYPVPQPASNTRLPRARRAAKA